MESKGPWVFMWRISGASIMVQYTTLPTFSEENSGFALYFAMMKWAVLGAAAVAQLKTEKKTSHFRVFCVSLGASK